MAPWLWGVTLFIVFIVGGMILILWRARSIKANIADKVYVTILKSNGARDNMLLPSDGLTVTIPKAGKKKGAVILDPQCTFDMMYPPGEAGILPGFVRDIMRATVTSIVVAEGYGDAYAPFMKESIITDDKINAIKSEAVTKAIVDKGYARFGGGVAGKFPLKPIHLIIGFAVLVLVAGAGAFLAYMAYMEVGSLGAAFGV